MRQLRYGIAAIACVLIISGLFISSCKSKPKPGDSNSVSSAVRERRPLDKILVLPDNNEVAATVNGVEIKESRINEILAPALKEIADDPRAANLTAEKLNELEESKKLSRENILRQLIIDDLLDQEIKTTDVNITVTTKEADDVLQKQLAAQSADPNTFKEVLKDNNMTYDDAVNQVKKQLIFNKFVSAKIADKANVTEEEAKKFYDDNPQMFEMEEQVRASHILVPCAPNEPNDVQMKAKAKIEDLLKQVKEGADFAELAKKTGGFPSAPDGGDLGYFTKYDRMAPEFAEAAFSLEPNQVSDVVHTEFGYHIIKVTDHKKAGTASFDEVHDKLMQYLKTKKENEAEDNYYKSLIDGATITFPEGKELKF